MPVHSQRLHASADHASVPQDADSTCDCLWPMMNKGVLTGGANFWDEDGGQYCAKHCTVLQRVMCKRNTLHAFHGLIHNPVGTVTEISPRIGAMCTSYWNLNGYKAYRSSQTCTSTTSDPLGVPMTTVTRPYGQEIKFQDQQHGADLARLDGIKISDKHRRQILLWMSPSECPQALQA